jgi:hypothetical protein
LSIAFKNNTAAGRLGYGSKVDEENYRRTAMGEDIWEPWRPMRKKYASLKALRDRLELVPAVSAANVLL